MLDKSGVGVAAGLAALVLAALVLASMAGGAALAWPGGGKPRPPEIPTGRMLLYRVNPDSALFVSIDNAGSAKAGFQMTEVIVRAPEPVGGVAKAPSLHVWRVTMDCGGRRLISGDMAEYSETGALLSFLPVPAGVTMALPFGDDYAPAAVICDGKPPVGEIVTGGTRALMRQGLGAVAAAKAAPNPMP